MDDLTLMEGSTPRIAYRRHGLAEKQARRRQRLQQIAELHAAGAGTYLQPPIGLPPCSKTPAEIALAVMAAIVQQKTDAGRRRDQCGTTGSQMLQLQMRLFPAQRIAETIRPVTGQPPFRQYLRKFLMT